MNPLTCLFVFCCMNFCFHVYDFPFPVFAFILLLFSLLLAPSACPSQYFPVLFSFPSTSLCSLNILWRPLLVLSSQHVVFVGSSFMIYLSVFYPFSSYFTWYMLLRSELVSFWDHILKPWFSECDPLSSNVSITWELSGNASTGLHPALAESETWAWFPRKAGRSKPSMRVWGVVKGHYIT